MIGYFFFYFKITQSCVVILICMNKLIKNICMCIITQIRSPLHSICILAVFFWDAIPKQYQYFIEKFDSWEYLIANPTPHLTEKMNYIVQIHNYNTSLKYHPTLEFLNFDRLKNFLTWKKATHLLVSSRVLLHPLHKIGWQERGNLYRLSWFETLAIPGLWLD